MSSDRIAAEIAMCEQIGLRGSRRAVFLLTRLGYTLADLRLLWGCNQDRNLRAAIEALSAEDQEPREYTAAELRNGQAFRQIVKNSDVRGPGSPVQLDDMGRERTVAHPQMLSEEQWAQAAQGLRCYEEE